MYCPEDGEGGGRIQAEHPQLFTDLFFTQRPTANLFYFVLFLVFPTSVLSFFSKLSSQLHAFNCPVIASLSQDLSFRFFNPVASGFDLDSLTIPLGESTRSFQLWM